MQLTMQQGLNKILNHYGLEHQKQKLYEEIAEVVEALTEYYKESYNLEKLKNLNAEIADYLNIYEQINQNPWDIFDKIPKSIRASIRAIYNTNKKTIEKHRVFKVYRTLIEIEYLSESLPKL